jgi:hypothetical protein
MGGGLMAAERIKVPGIGEVPKPALYATLGVAGGIVVWAWWKRKNDTSTTPVAPDPQDMGAANYAGTGASSAPITVNSGNGLPTFASNAEWTQYAADKLGGTGGWDAGFILVALGKFLGRQALTDKEIEVVIAAKGVAGDPPIGGPYQIIHALPTPTPTPTPTPGGVPGQVHGLTAVSGPFDKRPGGGLENNYIDAAWSAVAGADDYHVVERSPYGGTDHGLISGTHIHIDGLAAPDTDHRIIVSAHNSKGEGPSANFVVHTRGRFEGPRPPAGPF